MLRAGKLSKSTTKDITWFCNLENCYDTGNGTYITEDYFIVVLEDCCLTWKHCDTQNEDLCKTYFQIHSESGDSLHALVSSSQP
jgi:hypothetical protein